MFKLQSRNRSDNNSFFLPAGTKETTKFPIGNPSAFPRPRAISGTFFGPIKSIFRRAFNSRLDTACNKPCAPRASRTNNVMTVISLIIFSVRLKWSREETSLKALSKDMQKFARDHEGVDEQLKSLFQEIDIKLRPSNVASYAALANNYIPPSLDRSCFGY